jgi:beta-glucosidase
LLAATLGAAEIKGIQDTGALATIKHYIGYYGGMTGAGPATPTDVRIDERTLQEIYLPPYEAAYKAGVAASMAAYAHQRLLEHREPPQPHRDPARPIRLDRLHHVGLGAIHSTAPALKAGTDMEMPGYGVLGQPHPRPHYYGDTLKEALDAGQVSLADIDRAVARILTQMDRFGLLSGKQVPAPAKIDVEARPPWPAPSPWKAAFCCAMRAACRCDPAPSA